MCQVQCMNDARAAVAAGADVLVAQGNEAGGHTGRLNLLPWLAQLVDTFPDVPVMAAGGVASGRTLAGALAAGADGAWIGTALLPTPEAVEVSDAHKRRIVQSDGEDTVYTEVFDVVEERLFGMKWPDGIASRVYRNRFVQQWHNRENELRNCLDEMASAYSQALRSGIPGSHRCQWASPRRPSVRSARRRTLCEASAMMPNGFSGNDHRTF
jgi:nitronate monooxygenase